MEQIENKWKTFLASTDTPNTQAQLSKIQTYQALQNESKIAYAQWLTKHKHYQEVLNRAEENHTPSSTTATSRTKETYNVQHICTEYARIHKQLESKLKTCSTEEDLNIVLQLWETLDQQHSKLMTQFTSI